MKSTEFDREDAQQLAQLPLLNALGRVRREVCAALEPALPSQTARQKLSLGMLARLRDALEGVLALADKGLGYEAGAVARVLAECTIKLSWVGKDEKRAQVIVDQAVIDHEQMVRRWNALGIRVSAETEKAIREQAEAARARYEGVPKKKAGDPRSGARPDEVPKLPSMAQCVPSGDGSNDPNEFYDLHYRSLCISAHPDVRSLFGALGMRGLQHLGGVLVQTCLATHLLLDLIQDALAPDVNFANAKAAITEASEAAQKALRTARGG